MWGAGGSVQGCGRGVRAAPGTQNRNPEPTWWRAAANRRPGAGAPCSVKQQCRVSGVWAALLLVWVGTPGSSGQADRAVGPAGGQTEGADGDSTGSRLREGVQASATPWMSPPAAASRRPA
ncbi:hypothetical protein VULLAG_LOCUS2704 [Vulpes lagopus]